MTIRIAVGGRHPVIRDAIFKLLNQRPGEGLTAMWFSQAVPCTPDAARHSLWMLEEHHGVANLKRGLHRLHFLTPAHRDVYASAAPEDLTMATRRAQVLDIVRAGCEVGVMTAYIAAIVDVSPKALRHMLHDLVRCGEIFGHGHGHARRIHWFGSHDAMIAGKPLIAAVEDARRSVIVKANTKGGQAAASNGKAPVALTPRTTRRACGESMAARVHRARPAPERKEVEILGFSAAKFTPAVPKPDHRYHVDPGHRGEFSRMGPGRYIE